MSINEIPLRTSVAAINSGSRLRVYLTDIDGKVREVVYEGRWTGGTKNNVIAEGRIDTPVAATSLGLDHIRIYYIGADNKAKEAGYDSGKPWYSGGFSEKGFDVAPYSGISAVYLGGQSIIRVYGQLRDNTIQEWCWDGNGWTVGANLGSALPGTSIAATTWGRSPYQIRVYLQDSKLNIIEKVWGGSGWSDGLNFANAVTRASLGVTSWGEGNSLGIRLYYGAPGNVVKEKAWDSGKNWYDGGFSQVSVAGSKLAAIPLPILRVYLQNGTNVTAVTEFAWSEGWRIGYNALPPSS